jgi:type II secretory pathway component PulF
MSYFKWIGVDITGTTKKGKRAASSFDDLSQLLLQQDIALLWCKQLYTPSFLWPINAKTKSDLFAQISQLLRAGVLLPNTLFIIAQQSRNPIIYDIFYTIARDVQHGACMHNALEQHAVMHDPIVALMLVAGSQSGDMIRAIECVTGYFESNYRFNKNLRAVLAMPLLTLLFFMGICLFIFVLIIPRFADMLSSVQRELPPLTKVIIAISDFFCSVSLIYVGMVVLAIAFCIYRYCQTFAGKKRWHSLMHHVPFMGAIMWQHTMSQAFHALALLINSGIPLVDSLKIVGDSIDHDEVKMQFMMLHDGVAAGQLLSKVMATMSVFLPEVIALINVGQESATMSSSLESIAVVYTNRVEESLRRFVFFLQPLAIIILGLLVTTLIFAVYAPIMQLSHSI